MQLSIIIVNYNVKYFLEQCLYSVQAAIRNLQAEIIVVDNNSTDGSVAYLQPSFPWVKWIRNQQNTGFSVANNQAVQVAHGAFILFLNPDTLLPENCLEKCLAFMQAQPKAGALGIKMLDGSGQFLPESKRGFPSPLTSLFKLTGLAARFPRSRWFAQYYLGHISNHENSLADVLAGAFILVRHSVLQQVGSFDERFFMYGEDIDLSYRIQQSGWQNWYFADSSIIHFKGESTKKGSLNYVRMFYQAMNLFVQKHYSGGSALLYRWLIKTAIWARAGITLAASYFKKTFIPKETALLAEPVLIIASETIFIQIQQLLQRTTKSTALTIHFKPLQQTEAIINYLKANPVEKVIFGIDEWLPMQTIIAAIEQVAGKQFGFFYAGGQCLISSSSKNSSGQWISIRVTNAENIAV